MSSSDAPKPTIDRARMVRAANALGVFGTGSHSGPRLMAALCNPALNAHEIASLVAQEPALYARVLRVANSAYYGQSRAIATVERALVLLGLDAVRGIAAAVCLDRAMPRGTEHAIVDMSGLVEHSLATAAAADALARVRHAALASNAFIAGLLHNLGIPAQLHLDPSGVKAMLELRRTEGTRDMRAVESQCCAVGHEECIAVIFEDWKLPESIIASIRHHHDPQGAPEPERALASLINLGANMALAVGCTFALEPAPTARNTAAMDFLGVSDQQLDDVCSALPERVAQLSQALRSG